jgi:long-subunit acyl-CoA synthetase (AMP-forming)
LECISVPVYPTISEEDYEYIFNNAEIKYCFVSDKELYNKLISVQPKISSLMGVFAFDDVRALLTGRKFWTWVKMTAHNLRLKILPIPLNR